MTIPAQPAFLSIEHQLRITYTVEINFPLLHKITTCLSGLNLLLRFPPLQGPGSTAPVMPVIPTAAASQDSGEMICSTASTHMYKIP